MGEGEGEGEDVCAGVAEHEGAVAVALDAEFARACDVDADCGFDVDNVCGIDTAELPYAIAEEDAWRASMQDHWAGFCETSCSYKASASQDAAACVDGRCQLSERRFVCPAVFERMDPRARAAVDVAFDDDCNVDVDCAVVGLVAVCGDQLWQFADTVVVGAARDAEAVTLDIGSDCGDALAAHVRCNGGDHDDVSTAVCVEGHCQLTEPP